MKVIPIIVPEIQQRYGIHITFLSSRGCTRQVHIKEIAGPMPVVGAAFLKLNEQLEGKQNAGV
jgi:hypothetical protein